MRARSPLLLASRTDPVESGALHTSDRPTRAPLNLTWQVPAEWTQSGPYTLLSRSHASLAYLACPSYPMPRRFSVSLTFSVLCLSMVSLLFAADDGRDRSRLLYGTRNATSGALNHLRSASLHDDEILRSFSPSLFSPPRFFFFYFTPISDVRPFCSIRRFRGIAHCQKVPPGSLLPGRLSR